MAKKIVECVPNFSEGRRPEILNEIVNAALTVSGVVLLDKEMDSDHNRAVVSFVGEPELVKEAVFLAVKKAAELIDLNNHKGEHPRMGATDVIPFVPVANITMKECVQLAKDLGKRIGEELNIPIYLYEKAATRPERENLAKVRKGEYEGLRKEIETNPLKKPDFGPSKMGSAGATAVGARMFLVAFNANLNTNNLGVAKKIAKAIRERSGGFKFCKALGFALKERNIVQVSMNMVNYKKTPLFRVFEAIKTEAERYGVSVIGTEIVGLVPNNALIACADHYLRIENFHKEQIIEERLKMQAEVEGILPKAFLDEVASASPAPGGGSVSALAGSLTAALSAMVCALTTKKKKYKAVKEELTIIGEKANKLRNELLTLVQTDADAFNEIMKANKLPKNTEYEINKRNKALIEATKKAAEVPLTVMEKSLEALKLAKIVAEKGNPNSITDVGVAALMADSAIKGAALNVRINLSGFEDEEYVKSINEAMKKIRSEADKLAKEIEDIVESKI